MDARCMMYTVSCSKTDGVCGKNVVTILGIYMRKIKQGSSSAVITYLNVPVRNVVSMRFNERYEKCRNM